MRHARYRRTRRHTAVNSSPWFYLWSLFLFAVGTGLFLFLQQQPTGKPAYSEATPATSPVATLEPTQPAKDEDTVPTTVRLTQTHSGDDLRGDEPAVLIYHTHTTEAYTQTIDNPYVETSSWRTDDSDKSVVAVGEALAERLRREYGYCVIHDTSNHEPPSLSTAYERSEATMRAYQEKYPTLQVFIDVHRDAYTVTDEPTRDYAVPYGDETCRVMCVVGEGTSSSVKPYFTENLALAECLTARLLAMDERLARPVRVKPGRYNQHISPSSLLVEVGHNANTLEQALAVVPYLADALVLALSDVRNVPDTPQPELGMWVPTVFDKP